MKKLISKHKLNSLVISNLIKVKYLSWFSWSNAFLIFTERKKYLVTDSRYFSAEKTRCKRENNWFEVLNTSEEKWKQIIKKWKNIWIESDDFTLEKFKNWKKTFPNKKWIQLKEICKEERLIKSKFEIEKMKKAAKIAEKAFEKTIQKIKEWISEKEIAWEFEKSSRELWAEKLSFDTIVAFWKNSSIPHHQTWNTKLRKWDLILIDFWVFYQWYASDCTRTFLTEKNEKIEKIYNLVLKAQKESIEKCKMWMKFSEVFDIWNDIFKKEKLEDYFVHSLWHWIWLEIHESPAIYPKEKLNIEEWMVFTIEPWLYFQWEFWIRIEDTVFMWRNWIENFYWLDKELKILEI